jgi:hypothetical protein
MMFNVMKIFVNENYGKKEAIFLPNPVCGAKAGRLKSG